MQKCVNCHRINGAGGELSSELNTPANVTEYREYCGAAAVHSGPDVDPREVENAAIRSDLTSEQVDDVLAYLASMK